MRARWIVGFLLWPLLGCPETSPPSDSSFRPIWGREDLSAVAVPGLEHALVATIDGAIYRTSDAGRSWSVARSAGGPSLRGLSMADEESGWAIGPDVILQTRDGGRSWGEQVAPDAVETRDWTAVATVDARRAVIVGDRGVTLVTRDGGARWRPASSIGGRRLDGSEPARPALRDVFCHRRPAPTCWSVGDGGVVRLSADGGGTWAGAEIESRRAFAPIVLERGRAELDPESARRLAALAHALRGEVDHVVEIEPVADTEEIERLAPPRDPFPLFEILEARVEDARTLLAEAGLPVDRLRVRGEPPWSFRDYLDDEPRFLERYWNERRAAGPGLRVRILERPDLRALSFRAASGASNRGWAIGGEDELFRTEDGGRHWRSVGHVGAHALHALAWGRVGGVLVGAQGTLRTTSGADAERWQAPSPPRAPIHFDDYLDVDFSPDGRLGLIVGENGWCLRSVDGGASWEALGQGPQ
jgi:photosystem II stability/assembly factor-like uncharacterized protein